MPLSTDPGPGSVRPLTLLTDYGVGGEHVGALHLRLAADWSRSARIDIAHDIPPGDVRWGALTLARHAPSLSGAVHLAVVDPGVGGARRAIALELADGSHALGPDNGLLSLLGARIGVRAVADLGDGPADAPATFHGRDLFAPIAGQLAYGASLAEVGDIVAPATITQLEIPTPSVAEGNLQAEIAGRDRFGNVSLLAGRADFRTAFPSAGDVSLDCGHGPQQATVGRSFGDVPSGELLVYVDSNEAVSIAQTGGNAWRRLGCSVGDAVSIANA